MEKVRLQAKDKSDLSEEGGRLFCTKGEAQMKGRERKKGSSEKISLFRILGPQKRLGSNSPWVASFFLDSNIFTSTGKKHLFFADKFVLQYAWCDRAIGQFIVF